MPRNSSGAYTLPAGNPVVADTLIETAWANPTMGDIAAALTDSLDRNGRGGMLAPFKINDGTVTAPGLSFTSQTNLGLYRDAANVIGIAAGGVASAKFSNTAISLLKPTTVTGDLSITGAFKVPDGTAPLPSFTFTSDPNTGLFSALADVLGFSAGGAEKARLTANNFQFSVPLLAGDGTAAAPSHSFLNAQGSGLYRGVGQVSMAVGSAEVARWTTTAVQALQPFSAPAGTVALPSYTFTGTEDTGLYRPNSATIGVTVDAAEIVRWSATQEFFASDGTEALPVLSFLADANTGLFRAGADILGFATGGTEKLRLVTGAGSHVMTGNLTLSQGSDAPCTLDVLAPLTRVAYLRLGGNGNAPGTAGFHINQGPTGASFNNVIDQPILFYINSIEVARFSSSEFKTVVPTVVPSGTAALPGLSFAGDAQRDTGFWWPGADTVALSLGGIERARWTASQFTMAATDNNTFINIVSPATRQSQLRIASNGNVVGTSSFNITQDTAGNAVLNNQPDFPIFFQLQGVETARLSSTFARFAQPVQLPAGTAAAPSCTFTADTNTGLYSGGADILAFSTGGTDIVRMTNTQVQVASLGTAALPSITFAGDINTGIFSPGADSVAIALGGAERVKATAIAANLDVGFTHTAGSVTMGLFSALNQNTALYSRHNNQLRWQMDLGDAVAETGANAGANFKISRYSDAGALIDAPLSIVRSTGIVTIKTSLADLLLDVGGTLQDVIDSVHALIEALDVRLTNVEGAI